MSIAETLAQIESAVDADRRWVIAVMANGYLDKIRRLEGRVLLLPEDIEILFTTLKLWLPEVKQSAMPIMRTRKPTSDEEQVILNPSGLHMEAQPSSANELGTEAVDKAIANFEAAAGLKLPESTSVKPFRPSRRV